MVRDTRILLVFKQRVTFDEMPHARKISAFPNNGSTLPEQSLEVTHADHRKEQEADEMGKGEMRNTIRSPGTMMIHLWNTPIKD